MKRSIVAFFIIFFGISIIKAQPNGGFEDWTSESLYENPDGWQTLNFLSLLSPPNPVSVFKAIGIDKRSGNYALKLKTIFVNNNPNPSLIADTSSAIYNGKINFSPFSFSYGFPYTGRPEKLEFWYKYAPIGSDTARAMLMLRKWNGVIHDTIAYGRIKLLTTTSYMSCQVPLVYLSTGQPDSVTIFFASSLDSSARVGSTLFIDDVALTGWVGMDEQNGLTGKVKVFPNPGRDNVNIYTSIKDANEIKIFDSLGKLEGIYKIQDDNININTCLFSPGLYLYDINDKKENILFKGKFTVVK